MSTKIEPSSGRIATTLASVSRSSAASEKSAATIKVAARGEDTLKLTENAMRLQESSQSREGHFDAERVDQIRRQLADGSYRIDADKIASGLVQSERLLGA